MGASTKTVGGGNATQTATDWNAMLQGILQNGSAGDVTQPNRPDHFDGGPFSSGFIDFLKARQANPIAQAGQQTGLFQNAINSALQGNVGDVAGINDHASALAKLNNIQPANLPQVNADQVGNVDTNSGIDRVNVSNPSQIDLSSFINSILGSNQGQFNLDPNLMGQLTTQNQVQQYNPTNTINPNDPQVQAISQILQSQNDRNVGDLRERFGIANTGSSSGAANAEAMARAEINPQLVNALGELARQREGLNQNAFQINTNAQLQNAGLNQYGLINAIQSALQAGGLNANISAQNAQNAANAGGLALNQGNSNAQNQLAADALNVNQNQNIGQDILQRLGLNANIQSGNADRGLNAAQLNSNNALNSMAQYIQALNSAGALGIQSGQLGLQQAGLQQNAQQNILGQLFNSLNASNQLGTPQAQTVQTPGALGQVIGGLTGLAGLAAPFMGTGGIMGLLGGGGASSALPAIPGLQNAPGISSINLPQIQLPFRG